MTFTFLDLAREVIDLRSFSNLWYWIVLAVMWSTMSHWVLGVPYDMVQRANRGHDRSEHDMAVLAQVNVNRILTIVDVSGLWVTAFAAFIATGLAVLGWFYRVEFCQALFLLIFPMLLVGAWSVRTARRLQASDYANIPASLRRHRIGVQIMGVLFIFITAFWGMWVNVSVDPWGF
ncbi:component of SufBCD complex [Rhodophyticola sp. CCM32]|uniref:component of SufBCD complex n=1 Tax=Rhodophyticola sp. CCM32 TaxID=2916397 RepID=UPI00107F3DA6|nr:component of SufBCD complex [Rhodophyticola sp. CCM32]QBY00285.1 component of SufBCD complex [Rhodophyticola sp. CCM32]